MIAPAIIALFYLLISNLSSKSGPWDAVTMATMNFIRFIRPSSADYSVSIK
jgi:hypothetical protein